MNILLTGGSGFIGKHILKKLECTTHRVLAISRNLESTGKNISIITGDINNIEQLKSEINQFETDTVIHLSWEGIPDFSAKMCQNNLFSSIQFFNWIFENTNCKQVIISGSCFEYGKKQGVCKESDPVNINSYFTWAKHSLNLYLSLMCAKKDVAINWFRLFYVYGPGQREESLIPTLIKSIAAKEIPQINTPHNKNDFIYVGDVAKVFAKAVDADLPSGVYNLGSGYSTSIYDVCHMVEKHLLGTGTISKQVVKNGQKDEKVNFWADMNKTESTLNMLCNIELQEGIKKYIKSTYLKTFA